VYIYGIGPSLAKQVVEKAQLDPAKKADDLTDEDIQRLVGVLQSEYNIEGDLRRETSANIRRLISIGSYRGIRHRRGLPVRGQRTKTNARTRKGSKRTVGVVRGKEARSAVKAATK
jgi:small subunit ribosomal protein S13